MGFQYFLTLIAFTFIIILLKIYNWECIDFDCNTPAARFFK